MSSVHSKVRVCCQLSPRILNGLEHSFGAIFAGLFGAVQAYFGVLSDFRDCHNGRCVGLVLAEITDANRSESAASERTGDAEGAGRIYRGIPRTRRLARPGRRAQRADIGVRLLMRFQGGFMRLAQVEAAHAAQVTPDRCDAVW